MRILFCLCALFLFFPKLHFLYVVVVNLFWLSQKPDSSSLFLCTQEWGARNLIRSSGHLSRVYSEDDLTVG